MSKRYGKRSIKQMTEDVDKRVDAVAPAGSGVKQITQLFRAEICILRNDGATWGQIAEALRAAGFPSAAEPQVRLACHFGRYRRAAP